MFDDDAMIPPVACGHVLIVGGGASGTMLARHLLDRPDGPRVTLVEMRQQLGRGVAYSTRDMSHLLNTRASNMSAFAEDPAHFVRWLQARDPAATPDDFAPRPVYGDYLEGLLEPFARDPRLTRLRGEVVALTETSVGVTARLGSGEVVEAEMAVLATGHVAAPSDGALSGPWDDVALPDPDAAVVIVGAGLTMVDRVITLLEAGHRGPITALSRRGLLPRPHEDAPPEPRVIDDIPFGAPITEIMRWVRAHAATGDWRSAVDAIRPHVTAIWSAADLPTRRRFLRHAAIWWDTHRHRMPASSARLIEAARQSGQLRLLKAGFARAERTGDGLRVHLRGGGTLDCAQVIDCRGIRRDPRENASPLFAGLFASGAARLDPLRLGPDVTPDGALIGAEGHASPRLRAMGPVSRAALWEITAIPDIRAQVARLTCETAKA